MKHEILVKFLLEEDTCVIPIFSFMIKQENIFLPSIHVNILIM